MATGRRILVLTLGVALAASPALAGAAPAATGSADRAVPWHEARVIRSLSMGEYGAPAPTGVAWSPADGRLLVTGGDGGTSVLAVSPDGRAHRTVRIAAAAGGPTVAVDPAGRRLTAATRADRVEVDLADPARWDRVGLAALRLGAPAGATYDPAGAWYVLDRGQLVRVAPHTRPATVTRTTLGLDGSSLRGLAYNPRDGLLYTADPGRRLLYGLAPSGHVVATYDLGSTSIRDLRGMVFAPTADATDDPASTDLYVADAGGSGSGGRVAEVSLTAAATAAPANLTAALVRTVDTSRWSPSSPDPSGVTVLPNGQLTVVDGEVDEMSLFQNVNAWTVTRDGATVTDRGDTTRFTHEPTGVAYDARSGHYFTSDDDASKVFDVAVGPDGRYGTADDTWATISTSVLGSGDSEDVTIDTKTGELFVIDGVNAEVYELSPGPNGRFDGLAPAGDDTTRHFDVGQFGAGDPEGIFYDAARDTLFIVSSASHAAYELSTSGALLNVIDIRAAGGQNEAGIALAPPSAGGSGQNLYVVDRRVDNNDNASENDGRMYEMSVPLPPTGNVAPTVSAGPDVSVTQPNAATLNGSVTDDGLPNPPGAVTSQWSMVSGPGTVTFANASSPATTATFSAPGTYVLRLAASDSLLTGSDEAVVTVTGPNGPFTLDRPIATGADDAEEAAGGSVSLTSGDLELVNDGTDQTVGLRFTGVSVPPGSTITSAAVQFQTDEVTTGATSLVLRGQAADNAPAFTSTSLNLSSRPRTTASVAWTPPAWSVVGARGPDQRTPDLSPVVQEVVGRPGWASGNALVLLVNGTGRRTAESFEGGAPPVLQLVYTTGGAPTNKAPTVNAGPDQTITLPAGATLSGTASDDGLPSGTLTTTWSKVSGPGTVTFANPAAQSTTATFSTSGSYVLRLTASDGALTSSDDVTVTVNPQSPTNTAPLVSAGPDQTITLPAGATLSGAASDDGLPNGTLTTTWSQVSGPGTVTFANPAAQSTTATFSTSGSYVLRLTASDGALTNSDEVTITVNPAPPPGTTTTLDVPVSAGSDDAEQSPSGGVNLTSSDLELVTDGTTVQTVGIRFAGLAIPKGAVVTNAYLQFTTDEVSTDTAILTVAAQAADNAATFTTTNSNISTRPRTTNTTGWTPPPWTTVSARTADQRTPNLAALVQEVVNRTGWNSGQAIAFIITGSGRRTAASFNGTRGAPILHVEYHT